MTETIIKVENLSKSYLIGHKSGKGSLDTTLGDALAHGAGGLARRASALFSGGSLRREDKVEEFWALRDVNFSINQGEIIGIIGPNGAGKSTLLKVLSRITEPSKGRITLNGRVSSLLEVGTGFHRELTGRENIFLNGAILGMTQREIKAKFDEIVAFAGTEQFLDTPVKRYSSGMYMRLAFAVAAHLEPEILIVDEVLAVGDAEFQKKCLGKMDEVSRREGRTVLLVSHNLAAITELTRRAIMLEGGHVAAIGPSSEVVSAYYSRGGGHATYERPHDRPTRSPHIRRAEVITSEGGGVHTFGKSLEVRVWLKHDKPMLRGCFAFIIYNQFRQAVVQAYAFHPEVKFGAESGETELVCRLPNPRLNVGQFYLRTFLNDAPPGESYEQLDGICSFEVVRTDTRLWGWSPGDCAYHEDWEWAVREANAVP